MCFYESVFEAMYKIPRLRKKILNFEELEALRAERLRHFEQLKQAERRGFLIGSAFGAAFGALLFTIF